MLDRENSGAGTEQTARRSDSGQAIYDHQPWDVDFRVPNLTTQGDGEKAPGYEDGSKYKVGGEPVGQREDDEAEDGRKDPDDLRNWWARLRAKYPEPLAEFAAVSTLMISRLMKLNY